LRNRPAAGDLPKQTFVHVAFAVVRDTLAVSR